MSLWLLAAVGRQGANPNALWTHSLPKAHGAATNESKQERMKEEEGARRREKGGEREPGFRKELTFGENQTFYWCSLCTKCSVLQAMSYIMCHHIYFTDEKNTALKN